MSSTAADRKAEQEAERQARDDAREAKRIDAEIRAKEKKDAKDKKKAEKAEKTGDEIEVDKDAEKEAKGKASGQDAEMKDVEMVAEKDTVKTGDEKGAEKTGGEKTGIEKGAEKTGGEKTDDEKDAEEEAKKKAKKKHAVKVKTEVSESGDNSGDNKSQSVHTDIYAASDREMFVEGSPFDERDIIRIPHESPKHGRTVFCTKRLRAGVYYGPPNARVYRLERPKGRQELKDLPNVTNGRYGEKKDAAGDYLYTYDNVLSLSGILLEAEGGDVSKAVELLDPSNRDPKYGYPDNSIELKWDLTGKRDGHYDRSWETRTTIRRLWNQKTKTIEVGRETDEYGFSRPIERLINPVADWAIFDLAVKQEERFREWDQHLRPSAARSPTPFRPPRGLSVEPTSDPQRERVRQRAQEREWEPTRGEWAPQQESRPTRRGTPMRARSATAPGNSNTTRGRTSQIQDSARFKEAWRQFKGIGPEELSGRMEALCLRDWCDYFEENYS